MKKLLVGILTICALSANSQTQAFKDKITDKVNSTKSKKEKGGVDYSKMNQIDQANFLISKNKLKESKAISNKCEKPKYAKLSPITLKVVQENNSVRSFKYRNFIFTAMGSPNNNNPNDITCWGGSHSSDWGYILIYNGGLYGINRDPFYDMDFCIKYCYGKIGASVETLQNYVKPFVENRKATAKKNAELAKKKNAELKQKYTIEGKEISKIEVMATHDEKFGIWSSLKFGIETTLKDGSKIKTSNIGGNGYLSDFNIDIIGVESDIVSGYQVSPQVHKLEGDYISIKVSAKHDKIIKTEKKIILNYKNSVKLYYNGGSGFTGPNATSGRNLRIEAKGVKHTETGEALVQYNVYNLDGDLINSVRLRPDRSFFVSTKGGNGSDANNKNAYNGANGGNITLVIDTNLKDYTFDYNVAGGNGGTTNSNSYSNGRSGRDGTFTKKVQTIKW